MDAFTEQQRRVIGLNLTGGVSNALELSTMIYKTPTLFEWGDLMDEAVAMGEF